MKDLSTRDFDGLKKLIKQIQVSASHMIITIGHILFFIFIRCLLLRLCEHGSMAVMNLDK